MSSGYYARQEPGGWRSRERRQRYVDRLEDADRKWHMDNAAAGDDCGRRVTDAEGRKEWRAGRASDADDEGKGADRSE